MAATDTVQPPAQQFERGGRRLTFRQRPGRSPTIFFLPGYASDMDGAKALAIDAFAAARGCGMLRFDYSGTGLSGGDFSDGTLAIWLDEALDLLDRQAQGPVVLVGSSMGGWIALHLALRRPDRVAALVGIAAAPDFTDWGFGPDQRAALERDGRIAGDPLMTRGFWQSGQDLLLLGAPIPLRCPVRLVHGERDPDVPVMVAARLLDRLESDDARLTVIKGGGHRLSEPHEIDAILDTIGEIAGRLG